MAGRVQLATKGAHDTYFTDNPDFSHFIKSFRKHSKFSKYNVKHDLHGKLDYGHTLKCTIPKGVGDLMTSVRLHFELPALYDGSSYYKYIESIGHALIKHVDMFIGGQHIQRVPCDFLQIYSENYVTQAKQVNLSKLIGKFPEDFSGTKVDDPTIKEYLGNATTPRSCIVDIPFYFYNNPELAVSLCALKTQECHFEIELNNREDCILGLPMVAPDIDLTFAVTVSGGVFYIDGSVNPKPTITLYRGFTYSFDQTDVSNASHPIRFSENVDGPAYNTGTDYTSSPVTITVDNSTPSTLYYYCNNHAGMGGIINVLPGLPPIYKPGINSLTLETELIALGDEERIRVSTVKQDHIITQVQNQNFVIPDSTGVDVQNISFKTEFINPVKEMFFVIKRKNSTIFDYDHTAQIIEIDGKLEYINYEHLKGLTVSLNDEEVIDEFSGNVISLRAVQSGIHHSRTQLIRRFYSYSFALEPERWYPTGQRNFSLVKEQKLKLKLNGKSSERELRVYTASYNILRYENGGVRLLFNSGSISN